MELETKWSQHSNGFTDLHHQLAACSCCFIAAMKRCINLFLNGIYCMTRIFNTDTVYEILFNCVSVWCLACKKFIFPFHPLPDGTPAGYGSIFISHSTFSFIVTLLMPADGYSSGHLMPVLVCVCDRGGES